MHVFLSYAKADTYDLAMQLDAEINALPEVTCWVDHEMIPGHSWPAQIEDEIERADVMVVLLSPDVNRKPTRDKERSFVIKEITLAQYLGVRIIPVMAMQTRPPIQIIEIEYIDCTANLKAGQTKLLAHIRQLSGYTEPTPKPPPQKQPAKKASTAQPKSKPRVTKKAPPSPITQLPPVPSMLPAPFNWLNIPAGKVTIKKGGYLEEETTFDIPSFTIAQYPITVAQYAAFSGKDYDTTKVDHPVTEVNWFESIEFCQWLSEQTGLSITLPTEQQWQRAAQGDTDWKYPSGDEFDSSHCNTRESGIGTTTAVTQYPNGASPSPYGVQDMGGNVWEWCLTDWKTGSSDIGNNNSRPVLRGGSFNSNSFNAACAYRDDGDPNYSNSSHYDGFRVVCSPLS